MPIFPISLLSVSSGLSSSNSRTERNFSSQTASAAGTSLTDAARAAMTSRGIDNPDELLRFADPAAVLRSCEWWDRKRGATAGLLAKMIRDGGVSVEAARPPAEPEDPQKAYGESVREWLARKMPELCKPAAEVVEWTRRVYGDAEADRLAGWTGPHPAAVAAVIRLHHRVGKLRVKEHGGEIRAAVRAADEEAIADYRAIAARREQEEMAMVPRPVLVAVESGGDE